MTLFIDSIYVLALGPHQFEIQREPKPAARRDSEIAAQALIAFRRAVAAAFFLSVSFTGSLPSLNS